MYRLRSSLCLAFFSFCLTAGTEAQVGRYDRRYEPARPTLSPYLNLMRPEVGILPNYHSLVRPMLRQEEINRRTAQEIRRNVEGIDRLAGQERTLEQPISGKVDQVTPAIRPTGTRSTFRSYSGFRSYSHYFPGYQGRSR